MAEIVPYLGPVAIRPPATRPRLKKLVRLPFGSRCQTVSRATSFNTGRRGLPVAGPWSTPCHRGDAVRSELAHTSGHVLGAIVDRDRAQLAHALLLSRARGPDHPNTSVPRELDQRRSDAASRSSTTIVCPSFTRAVRYSMRHAVTPFTTTVSAAAASRPSGTGAN